MNNISDNPSLCNVIHCKVQVSQLYNSMYVVLTQPGRNAYFGFKGCVLFLMNYSWAEPNPDALELT